MHGDAQTGRASVQQTNLNDSMGKEYEQERDISHFVAAADDFLFFYRAKFNGQMSAKGKAGLQDGR